MMMFAHRVSAAFLSTAKFKTKTKKLLDLLG